MKNLVVLFALLLPVIPSCTDEKSTHKEHYQVSLTEQMQFYIDSGSYYYLKAIEGIESGGDKMLIERQYAGQIVFFHKRLSVTFDSITSEYMNKRLSQKQYDEIRNSLVFDSVIKRRYYH